MTTVTIGRPITVLHAWLLANDVSLMELVELSGVCRNTLNKAKKGEARDWDWKGTPNQSVGVRAATKLSEVTGIEIDDLRSLKCRLRWKVPVISR